MSTIRLVTKMLLKVSLFGTVVRAGIEPYAATIASRNRLLAIHRPTVIRSSASPLTCLSASTGGIRLATFACL